MRIANIMFGRRLGGIEQAFIDYNQVLIHNNYQVLSVTDPNASVKVQQHSNLTHATLANNGNWDPLAAHRLKRLLKKFKPDATILHGNRAIRLAQLSGKHAGLHVGVTHNYRLKSFANLDLVFATTKDLHRAAFENGVLSSHIEIIPNMINAPVKLARKPKGGESAPIIIGAMGRLVEKKGFDQLLQSIAKLKTMTRANFKLILGGEGEEEAHLRQMIESLNLSKDVELLGWVNDKRAFYQRCDIFCLPSLHEPFGIVLLEAMAYGVPVVAYESEGPHDIFMAHPESGIRVPVGDTGELATAIERLIHDPTQREYLIKNGFETIQKEYSLEKVAQKIEVALSKHVK